MARQARADFRPIIEKTINELEGVTPALPALESNLTIRAHQLRQKPIGQLSIEELRLMLGQKIAVPYLVPLALQRLEADPLVVGDSYPGGLLVSLLQAEPWWRSREDVVSAVQPMLREAIDRLEKLPGHAAFDDLDEAVTALHQEELADQLRSALERLT